MLSPKGHPEPRIVLWILVFASAVVTPNGIKMVLANGLSSFFINGKPVFSDGPKSLPRSPSDCNILDRWVFDNFILVDELFAKPLRSLETFLSVNNNIMNKILNEQKNI